MFSSDFNGADVTGTITYTISSTANSRHLLFDLLPNTTYDVTYTPDGQTITVTPGSGSYKSSNGGFSNKYSLSFNAFKHHNEPNPTFINFIAVKNK